MSVEHNNIIQAFQDGKVVLYPTDTIWGIGCLATNERAVERIYEIKERSNDKSLILLVGDIKMLQKYVPNLSVKVIDIINHYPRPITVVYNDTIHLPDYLKAADGSIAIRITNDDFCKRVIKRLNEPIISTSANRSGEPTAPIFSTITPYIKNSVDYIETYRQDYTTIHAPSTVAKINEAGEMLILRP